MKHDGGVRSCRQSNCGTEKKEKLGGMGGGGDASTAVGYKANDKVKSKTGHKKSAI